MISRIVSRFLPVAQPPNPQDIRHLIAARCLGRRSCSLDVSQASLGFLRECRVSGPNWQVL